MENETRTNEIATERVVLPGRREWASEIQNKYAEDIMWYEKKLAEARDIYTEFLKEKEQLLEKFNNIKTCKDSKNYIKYIENKYKYTIFYHKVNKTTFEKFKQTNVVEKLQKIEQDLLDDVNTYAKRLEETRARAETAVNEILYSEDKLIRFYDEESTSDDAGVILRESFVEVPRAYQGNGGYSNRYVYRDVNVFKGEINGKPAYTIDIIITTFYRSEFRGKRKYRFVVGWDDGKVFLTRVFTTSHTDPQRALEELIPSEVRKAKESGKKVIRWGDIWFVETNRKQKDKEIKEITIRDSHKILGWREGNCVYAIQCVSHPHHPAPDLSGVVWKVLRNKRASFQSRYD